MSKGFAEDMINFQKFRHQLATDFLKKNVVGASARFHNPSAVAVDGNNAILVTDRENHRSFIFCASVCMCVCVCM